MIIDEILMCAGMLLFGIAVGSDGNKMSRGGTIYCVSVGLLTTAVGIVISLNK